MERNPATEAPSFKQKHSKAIRIWHWSTVIVITGSLTTVLFAKVLLNAKQNATLVQQNLQKNSVTVSSEQARSVAHEFSDLVWHWHIYIGYVLSVLLLYRILLEFFQLKEEKVIPILKNGLKYLRSPGADVRNVRHFLWVRYLYLLFYFSLFIQVCTGLFIAYSDGMPQLKNVRSLTKEIHNIFMWVIIGYIVIHICGVILAELGAKSKGIVSDMIHGGEEN